MAARVHAEPGNMVNVRERPALVRGNVVTKLPAGASVRVAGAELHDGDLWYRVQLPEARGGWIRGDLIELAAAPSHEARDSWQMRLELIPAIDRCLEQVTARPYAPQAAFFSELFGTEVRYTGASIGYQLASPLAGGLAPLISMALLQWSGGRAWPIAVYLIILSAITLVSVWLAAETHRTQLSDCDPERLSVGS